MACFMKILEGKLQSWNALLPNQAVRLVVKAAAWKYKLHATSDLQHSSACALAADSSRAVPLLMLDSCHTFVLLLILTLPNPGVH